MLNDISTSCPFNHVRKEKLAPINSVLRTDYIMSIYDVIVTILSQSPCRVSLMITNSNCCCAYFRPVPQME